LSYSEARTKSITSYFLLIKPRETLLLAFIGVCTSLIASQWLFQPQRFVALVFALTLGSAGCNGLTNYLDRNVDERMPRTQGRVLPMGLIQPAEKSLLIIIPLIILALSMAWALSPICFATGVIGVIASALWRKTITCTLFGIVAGCSPVLIGWFAFHDSLNLTIFMICLLVALWIPIHVWSVIVAKRDEYRAAGLAYFPISMSTRKTITAIFVLTLLLVSVSLFMYFYKIFGLVYVLPAGILGAIMLASTLYMTVRGSPEFAWKIYRLSSFPYLGISFIAMAIDRLIA
jgi:protoheme IX farnesyltransferase